MDIVGAGSGVFQGVNIPAWPVAVTIFNNVVATGSSCYNSATQTYGVSCFDQINIIVAANQTNYPRINATGKAGCSTTSQGVAYGQAASYTVNGVTTTFTLAQTAAEFKNGDQLLFELNNGTQITSVKLTTDAVVATIPGTATSAVAFAFNPTQVTTVGTNLYKGTNTLANDPLDITACDGLVSPCSAGLQPQKGPPVVIGGGLGDTFCSTDWIIKLAPITYQVCSGPGSPSGCDQTAGSPDIQDPKLVRIQSGNKYVVTEQVIGFKVEAALWNGNAATGDNDSTKYYYGAQTYPLPWNFTLVRSVRVSLIGRTTPSNTDTVFKNAFDNGHYQVQGIAVVVNPRNMSMNDN
jgi:hypothetical protein